jgi:hypothetical protein
MPTFAKGKPRHPNAGRKRGTRNKRTTAAEKLDTSGLAHLVKVLASEDPVFTPELKVRVAIALASYQQPKPTPLKPALFPLNLKPPQSAQEARDSIAKIASMIAMGTIDGEHGARIVAALEAFLNAKAAELEEVVKRLVAEDAGNQ